MDGESLTNILNISEEKVVLNFSEPFVVEEYLYSNDFSKIRISHLNPEEKHQKTKLCSEFSDVFYNKNDVSFLLIN